MRGSFPSRKLTEPGRQAPPRGLVTALQLTGFSLVTALELTGLGQILVSLLDRALLVKRGHS